MKIYTISKDSVKPAIWDGGETYEYFIHPINSSYQNKDFQFRVSYATINKVPSIFTKFGNYDRFLVMLGGDLKISRNSFSESYNEHEVFNFDSNDEIKSFSKGRDFNLMVSKNITKANVEILDTEINSNKRFLVFYGLFDTVLLINKVSHTLGVNDCLIVDNSNEKRVLVEINQQVIFCSLSV